MKRLLLILLSATLAAPLSAQLEPPNEAGVTMGHVHLNVPDADLYRHMWIDHLGAKPLAREGLNGVKIPGLIILFREQTPSADMTDTALDHFGLFVRNRDELLEEWRGHGHEVGRVFTGSEGFPNAYLNGPGGFRMELQEDLDLPVIATPQHLHYITKHHLALQEWYQENFDAVFSHRGSHDGVDLPGINFSLDPERRGPRGNEPTKGRIIDHIGFEVKNLEAFCKRLEAKGIVFDQPYRKVERIGLGLAFLTDPSGVYIELTEGLDQY